MTNRDKIIEVMARGIALNSARQKDYGEDVAQKAVDATWIMWIADAASSFDALAAAGYWIAPNEPTEGMLNAAAECSWIVTGTPYKRATLAKIAIAIRDAFLREKECRDNG